MAIQKKVPVNLTISKGEKEDLEALAKANGLSISALLRFLHLKAKATPEKFGLNDPNPLALTVNGN